MGGGESLSGAEDGGPCGRTPMQHQSELLRVCVKGSSGPPTAPGRSLRSAPGSGHGREADPWSLQTVLFCYMFVFHTQF